MAPHALPIGTEAQRRTERLWLEAHAGRPLPDGVRQVVRDSWARALHARIAPAMPHAPTVWDDDALAAARERTDWLPLARRALAAHEGAYAAGGHILALFDGAGRMLAAQGDPVALDGLQEINFRPGSLWAEHAVGTNGPGTALATGHGVHVVGAEHFCAAWQRWHCAAVPVRDQLTGDIRGVVDLSGFRDAAHPHTLALAVAIAVAIEQMLAARDAERRVGVVRRFADLAGRWPGDALVAVDRTGAILAASHGVPAPLHPLAPVSDRRRVALAEVVNASTSDAPREVWVQGGDAFAATAHPVFDGEACVGACLVLRSPAASRRVVAAGTTLHDGAGRLRRGGAAETRYSLLDVVGEAPALAEAQRIAVAAAANALPVLILGESGTGKELFAQGIHAASARAGRPFVAVNCAALPRELIESELFGYVGGAFSGSRREGSAGKFEAADGGTIFLDEVSELPPAAQATLLRVLQEGEVTRVGATQARRVDVRVIAATNCDLAEHLASGGLRRDLYYRLGVLAIELAPLRERRADVPRLARRFLAEAEEELSRPGHTFGAGVLEVLTAYDWPGNVRELKNLVRRLVALVPADEITVADLPHAVREAAGPGSGTTARGARAGRVADVGSSSETATPGADPRTAAARDRIVRAVRATRTMAEAAAQLGVTRSTLYRQMARYGLHPERVVREDA